MITNSNMGKDNTFTSSELADIKQQKGVDAIGPLLSNQFRVKANAGNIVPFSTDLFLETIPVNFIDTIPASFEWKPGQEVVPIIFSSEFLEMYNVFAPAQGLPQLSAKTISSVNIGLECSGNGRTLNLKGNIVGLTDRINSILVPQNFMAWANNYFNNSDNIRPERVFIKTKDANDPVLLKYMDDHNFHLNKDKTKFGRIKSILQGIVTGLGIFGFLVIILALMLFSFYLQLMIARSKENLSLLVNLGYGPGSLSKMVARTWVPVYTIIIFISIAVTWLLNYLFLKLLPFEKNELSFIPHWSIFTIGFLLLLLSAWSNYFMVKRQFINTSDL